MRRAASRLVEGDQSPILVQDPHGGLGLGCELDPLGHGDLDGEDCSGHQRLSLPHRSSADPDPSLVEELLHAPARNAGEVVGEEAVGA